MKLKLRQNLAGNNPGAVLNVVIVLEMDKSEFLWDSGKLGAGTSHPHPVTGDMGHRCGAQHSYMSFPAHSPGQGQPCPRITHYTHKTLCNRSHSLQFPPTHSPCASPVPMSHAPTPACARPALSPCHTTLS